MSPRDQDPDATADGGEDTGDPSDSGDRIREDAAELRRRAETRMDEEPTPAPTEVDELSKDEIRRTLHELRVHQIELEMQNEELRQSRAELEASHERYFDLFDLAPVGYFTLAEDARILEANLTGGKLLSATRSTLVSQPFTRFIVPDDQDDYYHHRRAVVNADAPATCELRMVRADGSPFHALLESAPSLRIDDHATFRTVVSDITERTRATAERLLLEKRLQQVEKAESLGRMAGAMTHHFNNLLGVITGNLEVVLEKREDDPEGGLPDAVVELSDALTGARTATDLTQLLLAYLGHSVSEPVVMDLSEIARRSISLLQIAMPPGTELKATLPAPGPLVRVGPKDIQQLLTNLVTNAWEASEPGSACIHLSVSTVRANEISEEHRFPAGWQPKASSYGCIQVRDEGPGIELRKLDEVFDPFYTSKTFGRGLGLSVALGTAKAHEGAISIKTRPGQGATFRVYLPEADAPVTSPGSEALSTSLVGRKTPEVTRGAEASPTPEAPTDATTVLVVEDNEMVRKLAVRILGRMGFRVLEAADGVEALDVFEEHRDEIKVVLCDVTMPRMGGWETLTALRRIDPTIPVILTSGYDEAIATAGSHLEQPDAFVGKPWQLEQLRDVLSRVVDGLLGGGHGPSRWE
ncbi:MAG: PAS domain-containing sensor histidine kinase [Gemmatimonadales bacterium]|nr:MAG: PAS domain-containing sensor histidine kinase [Gemmatimonadales bacterium]